jgi:hypothetical protein
MLWIVTIILVWTIYAYLHVYRLAGVYAHRETGGSYRA